MRFCFSAGFLRLRNTFVKQYKQTAKVVYFIYANMVILQPVIKKGGDSVRSTIAAVVLLQLKFSPPLTNVINCFMAFRLESSFLTSIFRRNLTLPIFKFCCSFVVLFFPISLLWIWNSLRTFCLHHHNAHKPE